MHRGKEDHSSRLQSRLRGFHRQNSMGAFHSSYGRLRRKGKSLCLVSLTRTEALRGSLDIPETNEISSVAAISTLQAAQLLSRGGSDCVLSLESPREGICKGDGEDILGLYSFGT